MFDKVFDLNTLNGTNGFKIPGLESDYLLGFSVSTAGDINDDGKADLILGSLGNNRRGTAYVIFGQNTFPAEINLAALNGTNGFTVAGLDINDNLGAAVSNAGDINGDGKDDLIIAASTANGGSGTCYIIFGQKSFPASFDVRTLNGSNGFTIPGLIAGDVLGAFVSSAGDMNGDGIIDLLLGAYQADEFAGAGYVVFGQKNFPASFDLRTLNGSNGFTIPGLNKGDRLGISLNSAGDINGDGKNDIVLGAISNEAQGTSYVVLIFGQTNFPPILNLTTLNGMNGFVVPGLNAGDSLGASVDTAGDINGDGKADLILGAAGTNNAKGTSYVIFGQTQRFPKLFDLNTLDGSNGFMIPGLNIADFSGSSVSTAGDINHDGKDDIIIGAFNASNSKGAGYVIFGQTQFPASFDLGILNGTNGFTIFGLNKGDQLGSRLNTAGDINADRVADIVLDSLNVNNNHGAGYVIFGKASTPKLLNNQLTITQDQSIILNSDNLSAADLDISANELIFTISQIKGGRFELITNPNMAITTFVQQKIMDLQVRFVQDGSRNVGYDVSVTNGVVNTKPANANVTFKFAPPILVNNQMTIQQGKSVILTPENLSATDLNFPANTLIFNVNYIQGGQFELLDKPGVSVTSFTQQDIIDTKIQFVQDGSKNVGYEISVSDANGLNTPPTAAHVNFIRVYQPPKLNNPIPDQSAKVNVPFNIEIPPNTFIDPDGDFNSSQLIYSASQADGKPLPDWVSFANQSFLGTAPSLGNNQFSLFAANPTNRSAVSGTNFSLSVVEASLSIGVMIGIGAGGVLLLIALGTLLYCCKKETLLQPNLPAPLSTPPILLGPNTPLINSTDDTYHMDFRNPGF